MPLVGATLAVVQEEPLLQGLLLLLVSRVADTVAPAVTVKVVLVVVLVAGVLVAPRV